MSRKAPESVRPAQLEREDVAVEVERFLDVADFERDVVDADEASAGGVGVVHRLKLAPCRHEVWNATGGVWAPVLLRPVT